MKALFLVFHGFESYNGISKKIKYQVEGLKQNGVDARLCYLFIDNDGNHTRMVNDTIIDNYGKCAKRNIQLQQTNRITKQFELKARSRTHTWTTWQER